MPCVEDPCGRVRDRAYPPCRGSTAARPDTGGTPSSSRRSCPRGGRARASTAPAPPWACRSYRACRGVWRPGRPTAPGHPRVSAAETRCRSISGLRSRRRRGGAPARARSARSWPATCVRRRCPASSCRRAPRPRTRSTRVCVRTGRASPATPAGGEPEPPGPEFLLIRLTAMKSAATSRNRTGRSGASCPLSSQPSGSSYASRSRQLSYSRPTRSIASSVSSRLLPGTASRPGDCSISFTKFSRSSGKSAQVPKTGYAGLRPGRSSVRWFPITRAYVSTSKLTSPSYRGLTETVPIVPTPPGAPPSFARPARPGTEPDDGRARWGACPTMARRDLTMCVDGRSPCGAAGLRDELEQRVRPAHRQLHELVGERDRIRKLEGGRRGHVYRLVAEGVQDVALFVEVRVGEHGAERFQVCRSGFGSEADDEPAEKE